MRLKNNSMVKTFLLGHLSNITNNTLPSAETIDKIADALNVKPSELFNERRCPENTKETFEKIYGTKLNEELKKRILKDIDEVCELI